MGGNAEPSGVWKWLLHDLEFLRFLLMDVVFAVGSGLVLGLITRSSTDSILVSLGVATIPLFVTLRYEISANRRAFSNDLAQWQETVAHLLQLQSRALSAEATRRLFHDIHRIMGAYSRLLQEEDKHFLARAGQVIARCANEMAKLEDGVLEIGADAVYSKTTELLRECPGPIYATSYVRLKTFWFDAPGREYLALNLARARANIELHRVFIIDSDKDLTPAVWNVIQAQQEAGIRVSIARTKALRELKVDPRDMAIFGDTYAEDLEFHLGAPRVTVRKATIYRDQTRIAEAKDRWDAIRGKAETADAFLMRMHAGQRSPRLKVAK